MPETIVMPKLGLDMTEGTFVNWVKKVGDPVKSGDVLAEIESDKATIEIESTASGVLTKTLVDVGAVVPVGAPIAEVSAEGAEAASEDVNKTGPAKAEVKEPAPAASNGHGKEPAAAAPQAQPSTGEEFPGGVKASPIARRIADEKGIDLRQVQGTGPGGRIQKSDVESFKPSQTPPAAPAPAVSAARPQPSAQVAPTGPGITEEPVSRLRARIASRMTESKQTIPHFYVTTEIDMAPALALRKEINAGLPEEQKITVNDLVVKAVALTLRQFPNLNSHFYGDKIVHFEHINIGIAVALDGGGLMNVLAKADGTAQ